MNAYRGTVGVLLLPLVTAGCASNLYVSYPSPSEAATGSVLIRLTDPATSVSVSVDGVLVVESGHTERIEVADVPAGTHEIRVVASAGGRERPIDHREQVVIRPATETPVLVATPAKSLGSWIYDATYFAVSWAVILIWDHNR